ncbi:MAG: citrate synthase [Clostridiales bacterium]|jgi:citrate synthase|nr:citrate synthase [Clostridiales bacterium]
MSHYFTEKSRKLIEQLATPAGECALIDNDYYGRYDVKRGLRDINGRGVVCGVTEISEIISSEEMPDGTRRAIPGELYYRGYDIKEIVRGFLRERRCGFEETTYLLLFGRLPTRKELKGFVTLLNDLRRLPKYFVRDLIMKAPSQCMMNALSRGALSLYAYDENADDISISNVLRQLLQLTAQFPLISVYGYNTHRHFHDGASLIIHQPVKDFSTAENILHLIREDSKFTELEALILDMCLILHAEHGGGNNSTFTTHVVSSSGTDTYAAITASLGSLKGPRHGGANIMVVKMIDNIAKNLKSRSDGDIKDYIAKLLDKEAFDKSGLIYGMGHAVYSISDPRADVLKSFVERLAHEKGRDAEYELYAKNERLAPEVIGEKRQIYKGVSANIDFYSGLVYDMLGLPTELYTPLFAISRIAGWGAHRIEELANNGKIIRPGYQAVAERKPYVPISQRE